jgi:hypothetical protein
MKARDRPPRVGEDIRLCGIAVTILWRKAMVGPAVDDNDDPVGKKVRFTDGVRCQCDIDMMIGRFLRERDSNGAELPLIVAAFDEDYLVHVLAPKAIRNIGGSERLNAAVEGWRPTDVPVRGPFIDDVTAICGDAIYLYTVFEAIQRETNRLLRLPEDANEPDAALWPFVAILQMALMKREKENEGVLVTNSGAAR